MPHTRITFTVEATEAAVHGARHRISTAVRRWGGPVDEELRFHLELVASELLTNGLRHARGPMTAEVTLVHDLVVVAVLDGCPELPQSRPTQIDDECGRGLALIEDLCLIQGAETAPGGKRCWAVLPVQTARDPAAEPVPGGVQDNDFMADRARWSLSPNGRGLLSSLFPAV